MAHDSSPTFSFSGDKDEILVLTEKAIRWTSQCHRRIVYSRTVNRTLCVEEDMSRFDFNEILNEARRLAEERNEPVETMLILVVEAVHACQNTRLNGRLAASLLEDFKVAFTNERWEIASRSLQAACDLFRERPDGPYPLLHAAFTNFMMQRVKTARSGAPVAAAEKGNGVCF